MVILMGIVACEGNLNDNRITQNLIYDHGYSGIAIYHAGGIRIHGNNIIGSGSSRIGIFVSNSSY